MDRRFYFKKIGCGPSAFKFGLWECRQAESGSPSPPHSALLRSVPFQLEHSRTPETTARFGRSSVCAECDLGGLGRARPKLIPFLL